MNLLIIECQNGRVIERCHVSIKFAKHSLSLYDQDVCDSKQQCRALEQIQLTVSAEIICYYNLIATDFDLSCSQSSSSVAILDDDILMQVFDINSSLCPVL